MATKTDLQKFMQRNAKTSSTLSSKITNAKTRLADVGAKKDTRNWLEKALNLKEKQNVLFDIAEVIDRPSQAIRAAISASQEGYDVKESALEGLTGKQTNSYGDILRRAGMDKGNDNEAELFNPSTWRSSDVLGTALDIFADPVAIPALPVKGATGGVKLISGLDAAAGLTKQGLKAGAKGVDYALETGLKIADKNKGITYANEFAKEASKLGKTVEGAPKYTKGNLEGYKALKQDLGMALNYKKAVPDNLVEKLGKETNKVNGAEELSKLVLANTDAKIKEFAKTIGKSAKEVEKDMGDILEAGQKAEISLGQVLRNKQLDDVLNETELAKVTETLTQLGVPNIKQGTKGRGWFINKKGTLKIQGKIDDEAIKAFDSQPIKLTDTRDAITLARQAELLNDPVMMKFYNENIAGDYQKVADIFKEYTGFDVSNIVNRPGYMRHKNIAESTDMYGGVSKMGVVSSKKLAGRKHRGTAADINRRLKTDKFSESYTESFADFIKNISEQAEGAKTYATVFLGDTFKNPDLVQLVSKKADDVVPAGMEAIDTSTLIDQFEAWGHLLDKDASKAFIDQIKGKRVYMDKRVKSLLFKQISHKEASQFMNMVGKVNNTFKKLKTFSPGFHMRNLIGNNTNMYLSGANMAEINAKYYPKAISILNKADNIMKKRALGAKLTDAETEIYNIIREFSDEGLYKSGAKVMDLEEIMLDVAKKKNIPMDIYNKAFELNAATNSAVDGYNRLALMMYAKDNPKYLKLQDAKTAGEAVRKVLFDPRDMSPFEQEWAKKFVPFYTFTKQNLFFQIDNIARNPVKYNRMIKANNMVWDGQFDENEYMDWQKQGFNLPLPINDSKGNPIMLKMNLPMSDLGEYMSDPLKRGVSSVTPILRAPVEAALGKEVFTGRDIDLSTFEGKKDFIAKNTGLDLFTKTGDKLSAVTAMEDPNAVDWALTLTPSVASTVNKEQNVGINQYNELQELQSYIKKLKDAGVAVRDIDKIKETAKQRLARLQRQRKKNSTY